ncbi:MAG: DUF3592 domain-containing protein [Lachnospiraceae bacterium]|nr:DUF3592 domain-containing protein [Lachnospiraceae bacterium]
MNLQNKVMGILFIIVGLTFAGLGIWVQFIRNSGYVPVEAEITKIEKISDSTNNWGKHRTSANYVAYVQYEVDGKTYAGPSNVWESGMSTGQTVTIFYNPDNPAEMEGDSKWLGWFIIGIGGIAVIAGGAMMFSSKTRVLK